MGFGSPRSFHKKFKFLFEIDGFGFFGFQKCSELSAEIAKIEYYEGGALLPDKSPGRVKVADVTIERAATTDNDLWLWFQNVVDMVSPFRTTSIREYPSNATQSVKLIAGKTRLVNFATSPAP